jgi:polysaccharide deacetylase 2 family uncharacterized protein YibQ
VRLWGWLAFVIPLAVYVASLSPYVNVWDTAELQTVPYILGIAHPTGFPVFVLLGWAFAHALPLSTVAWRMSLLSALCMAITARVGYALCRRLGVPAGGACGAAVLFAVGEVAWTRGTRAEVHTLATLEAAVAAYAALAWYESRNPRWLVTAAAALGLGLATHPTTSLMLPGIAVLVLGARRTPRAATLVLCGIALVVPSLTYAYLPLRGAYLAAHRVDPTLKLGLPPGRPYWDYGNPTTPKAFLRYVSGSDFRASSSVASILLPSTYAAVAPRVWSDAKDEFPVVALVLALIGAGWLLWRKPVVALGLGAALLAAVPFAYGYAAESDAARYALPAYLLAAVLAAYGTTAIATVLAAGDRRARDATVMLAMAMLAVTEFWLQRSVFDQRTDTQWSDYVANVRALTPSNAVIVADWAFATPLAYAAYVEHSMGKRILETAHPSDDKALLNRWALRRPVYVISPTDTIIPGVRLEKVSTSGPNVFRVVPPDVAGAASPPFIVPQRAAPPPAPPPLPQRGAQPQGTAPPAQAPTQRHLGALPRLAIIIDDCGQWPGVERALLALPIPITASIMPDAPYTREIEHAAASSRQGVMLHLPMEPRAALPPAQGEITTAMTDGAIDAQVRADLARVPLALGVNNHEGSKATADSRVMRDVAAVLSAEGKYFVDSRTTAATVAATETTAAAVPTISRDVFLDDDPTLAAVKGQLERAAAIAKQRGVAVAIGHPKAATLDALRAEIPIIERDGVTFVLVQQLVGEP